MNINKNITILAISGSLRANSSNAAVIDVAVEYLKDKVNFIIYNGLAKIPPFDDSKEPPREVIAFREQLKAADGIFICQPEYAFGVSGVLKNAIDWTVSSGEFVYKSTALITAATGGDKAHAAMLLTFTALSAHVTDATKLLISFVRSKMDPSGNVTDQATVNAIHAVLDALVSEAEQNATEHI
jgi:NAD(P)H-dependent FMN reductase